MADNFHTRTWADSPDRDILTPAGCRVLLHIGEKALTRLIELGLPHVRTSNSYRFVRTRVIEWMATEGENLPDQKPG